MALLLAGGLAALQTASIASALPFSIILMFVAYGMLKALRIEGVKMNSLRSTVNTAPTLSGAPNAWQRRVETLVSVPRKQQVESFLENTVTPAMHSVADELKNQGLDVRTREEEDRSYLEVSHGEEIDFVYGVRMRAYAAPSFALGGIQRNTTTDKRKQFHAEVFLREGGQGYDLMGYTKEQVIGDVLDQYEKHMYFLHQVR
jgi:choline/glycine/proline betaine transport protein